MDDVFVAATQQLALLQLTELASSPPLSEQKCMDQSLVHQSFDSALSYSKRVKLAHSEDRATPAVVCASKKTIAGPVIQRNLALVGTAAVVDLIMPQINAHFAHMSAQFELTNAHITNMQATQYNFLSDHNEYPIQPKVQIPVIPPLILRQPYPDLPAPTPLPPHFPTTRSELFALTVDHIDPILAYYGIEVNDLLLDEKRKALARHLGLPNISRGSSRSVA